MSRNRILPITLSIGLVLIFGAYIWAQDSPLIQDYLLIHHRGTEADIALAFAVSLRNNDPAAYELIDPSLKSRLDDWIHEHRGKRCTNLADTVLLGKGTVQGYQVVLECFGENKWLYFEIDNIVVKDMRVMDWGKVKEQ